MKNQSQNSLYDSIRELPPPAGFKAGDTLVVFGEVFERGYVNGLIDSAKKAGLKVIYSTVGRRDENNALRALTADELAQKGQAPLINIPLEAGFDLEPAKNGIRPVDQLKEYGLTGWEDAKLDWPSLQESRLNGIERLRKNIKLFLHELEGHINPKNNLIFAHTMAGGFPRAKVVMPIANRVFKGTGARYSSSQAFWESEIGRLCDLSFKEVTGETFYHLLDLSSELRNKVSAAGGKVSYVAYGYHGNEICVGDHYEWYSYSPYLQGFAKLRLEEIAREFFKKGVACCVFNVPEILTNSSSIFLGVEVVLYPLLRALKKEQSQSQKVKEIFAKCQLLLKDNFSPEDLDLKTQEYMAIPEVRQWPSFNGWPQHNGPTQMEAMRTYSTLLIEMHKNPKELMTAPLSELVFVACGKIIFNEIWRPRYPVAWVGHDAVARVT